MTLLDQPTPTTTGEPTPPSAGTPAVAIEATAGATAEATTETGAPAENEQALPPFGPLLGWSIAIASILMFLGTGLPMAARTGSAWDGIGLGAFCAFWGGPGFGTMAAGAIWTLQCERAEHRSAPSAG